MEQLQALTTIGQQALQHLRRGSNAPMGWKQKSLETIQEAKRPSEMVRFLFLPQLTDLVNAVNK